MVVKFHERISTSRASSDSFHTEKITTIRRLRMKNRKYTYAISRVREHELNVRSCLHSNLINPQVTTLASTRVSESDENRYDNHMSSSVNPENYMYLKFWY